MFNQNHDKTDEGEENEKNHVGKYNNNRLREHTAWNKDLMECNNYDDGKRSILPQSLQV